MEITIKANAHYENGHNEHFCRETEVTDEEFTIIRQCAETNNGELDILERSSPNLYKKLYSLFYSKAKELEFSVGNYRRIRSANGQSFFYRRAQTHLSSTTMSLGN